jgi:hypothetical protein
MRRQRVAVITEFDAGDPDATLHALAGEILRYRLALRLLATAIGWASTGAPFGLFPPDLTGVRGVPLMARLKCLTSRRLQCKLRAWH